MWSLIVGSKAMRLVVAVLVVILTLFAMTLFIQKEAKEDLIREIQVEQMLTERETIKRVEEKLNETDAIVTSPDAAREWLLRRQSGE
tara:strand:+ start:311 stop:571 length:261 start_codon:yes stop_codon:yes gene_type:complete